MSSLSIVVPISNLAGQLHNLRSWLAQIESKNIQVVLVHDIKDDKTAEELKLIVDAFVDANLCLIEGQFGSPGAARNAGLSLANGFWTIFWDGDDIGEPEIVLRELMNLPPNNFEAIVFQYDIRNYKDSFEDDLVLKRVVTKNICALAVNPGVWRICFKTSSIQHSLFPELSMAEDQMFLVEIAFQSFRIYFSNAIAYHYFIGRPGQLTLNKPVLKDLVATMKSLKLKVTSRADLFLLILLLRQAITSYRKGDLHMKLLSLKIFSFLVFKHTSLTLRGLREIAVNR